jgi:hypothetical protein
VPRICLPGGTFSYSWLARRSHALAAWLIATFGQPSLTAEEAFLAQSQDHADCERRQRWLNRHRHPIWNQWL